MVAVGIILFAAVAISTRITRRLFPPSATVRQQFLLNAIGNVDGGWCWIFWCGVPLL